jgi:hypothetical protein
MRPIVLTSSVASNPVHCGTGPTITLANPSTVPSSRRALGRTISWLTLARQHATLRWQLGTEQ